MLNGAFARIEGVTPNHWTRPTTLALAGGLLFAVSMLVPVMRWGVSDAHATAGSARLFLGDGWALTDGNFLGSGLVPFAAAAVLVVLIAAAVPGAGSRRNWALRVAAAVSLYCPFWLAYVFAKKLEDDVYPGEGTLLLILGAALMVVAAWPRRDAAGAR